MEFKGLMEYDLKLNKIYVLVLIINVKIVKICLKFLIIFLFIYKQIVEFFVMFVFVKCLFDYVMKVFFFFFQNVDLVFINGCQGIYFVIFVLLIVILTFLSQWSVIVRTGIFVILGIVKIYFVFVSVMLVIFYY